MIRGWAADRTRLNTPINVRIYDGNTLLATVPANQPRPDVGAYLKDNGLHGFNIPTPAVLKNGQPHSVNVRFESSVVNLGNSPRSITCTPPPPPVLYEGYHDGNACDAIYGWAWDRNRPNTSISVDIYDGATRVATVLANSFRQDLLNAGKGNGQHGFVYPVPPALKTGSHTITIKYAGTNTNLRSTPKPLTCSPAPTPTPASPLYAGHVDLADCNVIRGWAADRRRLNTPLNVSVYDGNTLLARVPANQSRPDVGAYLHDNGLHGFNIPTPAALRDARPHSISVRFESSTTNLGNSPKVLTCTTPTPTPTPPPTASYEGYHDANTCEKIYGWAWDRSRPNDPVSVDIYDGATRIATVLANGFRQDLLNAGKGNGFHAFNFPVPASLKSGGRTITVRYAGTNSSLSSTPKLLNCSPTPTPTPTPPPPPRYVGYLDGADCNSIYGWAADRNRLNTSINVSIYDGNTLLTTVRAGQSRPDVGAYLHDNGLHGFSIPTPAALKDARPHSISVRFESSGSSLGSSPKTLDCTTATPTPTPAPAYQGSHDAATCEKIYGWAWDRNQPGKAVNVDIYDGASLLATVPANQFRPDLSGAGIGDGNHAFNYIVPQSLKDGRTRSIRARFSGTGLDLSGTPRSLTCVNAVSPSAAFTMSGGGQAGGNGGTLTYNVPPGGNVTISFSAAASQPGTGSITGYEWRSNGTVIDTRQSFSFTFGPGTHNISLRVTNSAGLTNTTTGAIQVGETAGPQIRDVSPSSPPRRDGDQEVVVSGSGFQQGLTVTAVLPGGVNIGLSGAQIRNVGPNSFTLVITLNLLGTYGIRVNNPDGGRSSIFNFSTQQPHISSISPSVPPRLDADQQVVVNGSGFQQGLRVTVFYPGGSAELSGTQIQGVSRSSFTMLIRLGAPGSYRIRVKSPDGGQSNEFGFSVP